MKQAKKTNKIAKFFENKKFRNIFETIMLCACFVAMLAVSFAWFSGRDFKFNTNDKDPMATLATLENKVDVIGYSLVDGNDGQTMSITEFKKNKEEDSNNKFIDADSFIPGALNGVPDNQANSIIEKNTNTKYIKVTNRSDMDIMVKTQFNILEEDYENLTAFWYLISDVTNDIVNIDTSNYDGTLTDPDEIKVYTYAINNKSSRTLNGYNENNINVRTFDNLGSRVQLGAIEEAEDHDIGTTRYFRLDYGLSELALRSSGTNYFNEEVKVDVYIYFGQVNAPDDEGDAPHNNIKEVYTATEFTNILHNVNLAYHGDTIKLMRDIEVDTINNETSVDLTRPLNIDLNGHKLTIKSDFNINYETTTDIVIDASKTGQLFVQGAMNIIAPNAAVTIKGANQRASGESSFDLKTWGRIYNGVGDLDDEHTGGLTLDNVYWVSKQLGQVSQTYDTNDLEAVVMKANSKLTVTQGVTIDEVYAEEISGVQINNYGTIGWIHLESMKLQMSQKIQIYIYNNGMISGYSYNPSIPDLQIDHTTDAIHLPTLSSVANTRIIMGLYSNSFTVGGSNNFTVNDVVHENEDTQYVTPIKNESNAYKVYIDTTIEKKQNSVLRSALERYFSYNGEVNYDSIKAIEKLVIETTTDTYVNLYDFNYLKSDDFRDLSVLNLENANVYADNYQVSAQRLNRIPVNALSGKASLTEVILPNTVKYISDSAFKDTSLTSITIPSFVSSIGNKAFNTVNEVKIMALYPMENSSFLPAFKTADVYYLVDESAVDTFKDKFSTYGTTGKYAADHVYCYSFLFEDRYIRILDDGSIEIVAFTGDIADGEIVPTVMEYQGNTTIVSSIGRDAYINTKNESGLTLALMIGQGIEKIGKNAFGNLSCLQTVTMQSATLIDSYAFQNCSALQSVTIAGSARINSYAFYKCSALETCDMVGAVYIDDNAFNGCSELSHLVIPNVTYLGSSAFAGCKNFRSVVLGKIAKLNEGTFNGCTLLESVGLTSTTTEIGQNAFKGCTKLSTIYTYEGTKLEEYAYFQYVTIIGDSAFEGCNNLFFIVCDNIEEIGSRAFYGDANIQYLDAPTVKAIGSYAFRECTSLSQIEIESATTIGAYAFYKDELIQYVLIPNIEAVGSYAFYDCKNISAVALGNFTAGTSAFYNVKPDYVDLSSYDYSDSATQLGHAASWHSFATTTKYYFAPGENAVETNQRKNKINQLVQLSFSASRDDPYQINTIYEKKTIMGYNFIETDDYVCEEGTVGLGTRNYIGISRNLGLYSVDIDTKTIIAYHGPQLIGYNVVPFNVYSEVGVSEAEFNTALEGTTGIETFGELSDGETSVYIENIGDFAFYGLGGSMLDDTYCTVVFAPSVKKIGESAFQASKIQFLYCNKVEEIQINAFRGTTELRFVDLGNTITVGKYAFAALNRSTIKDGSDITNYFYGGGNSGLSFTTSKLTKAIFRHVNDLGDGAFLKPANAGLFLADLSNNVPVEGSTSGFGPNNNVNVPTYYGINWMGYGVGTTVVDYTYWGAFDSYLLAPYDKNRINEVQGKFLTFAREEQILYNYGYVYNPDYEVNGVKVGMFLLRPPESGGIDQGLYLYKSFIRNLCEDGELIDGLSPVEGSDIRFTYEVPGRLDATKMVAPEGVTLNKSSYLVRLSSNAFRNTTIAKGYVCDLTFGDEITSIPTYCFNSAKFSNVYTNNVETFSSYSFYRCSLGTIYAYHLKQIASSYNYYGSCQIIDVRQNVYREDDPDHAGETLVASFDSGFMSGSSIKAIYVTEDAYDAYVASTKNVIISYNYTSNNNDTDLELYMYVTVPGMYFGTLDLLNTGTYDFSGLISPYTSNDTEEIIWESSDSSIIAVDEGVVSVGATNGMPLQSGSAFIYCYKQTTINSSVTKELLCKFKVNILAQGSTAIEYYNLLVNPTKDGFKVVKYSGNIDITNGIFDPSEYLTTFLDGILEEQDFINYSNSLCLSKHNDKYEISELGTGSYYGSKIESDAFVYLVTDDYLTEIGDYAFYHVAFYEAWLPDVVKIGRKSFLSGSSVNNLSKVVMPNVEVISFEAFSQNRNLETVVVGDNWENKHYTNLTTIDSNAFYASNSLKRFGIVKEDTSAFTNEMIMNKNYTLSFLKESTSEIVLEGTEYVTKYTDTYYGENGDGNITFIYLPDSLKALNQYSFYQSILIQELRLPDSYDFTTIGAYSFALCRQLNLVRTYQNIKTVGQYAFQNCEVLGDYTVDENGKQTGGISFEYFTTIGNGAFRQCYSLREIHFGAVRSIGSQAFYSCDKLRFIYFDEMWVDSNVTFGSNWNGQCNELLRNYVSADNKSFYTGAVNTYVKEAVGYREDDENQEHEYVVNYIKDAYDNTIGVKIACYNAVVDDVEKYNILEDIPDFLIVNGQKQPVLAIGSYAYKGFASQPSVETIHLPSSVNSVESYAFYDCDFKYYVEKLDDISSITETTYGSYVFANNILLESAEFTRMAKGGSRLFNNDPNFTTMILLNNVNQYGIYTAPVIASDFFSGARTDAKCTIKSGTIDLFSAVGYIGRVFENGSVIGDYTLKAITDGGTTKYHIIRYNVAAINEDYTVPDTLGGIPVSSIGMSAFTNITVKPGTTLTIPSSINNIETYAFYQTAFTNIIIQSSNITFGEDVFSENASLKSVDLRSLTSLTGEALFRNDTMLTSVQLGNSDTIPDYYFYGCTNLTSIDFASTSVIGNYAFANCSSLNTTYSSKTSYSLETGLADMGLITTIGDYAFSGDISINKIDFRSVKAIGQYAFRGDTGLTTCTAILSDATLSTGVFYGCTKLASFVASFKEIPAYCFYGDTSLATVRLSGVTSIGDYAFYGNTSIESITLTNVLTIGAQAFRGCRNLASVDFGRTNSIGDYAFYGDKLITSLDLKSVETIGQYAFYGCDVTGTLDLANVSYLGRESFENNINITEVYFRRVTNIGYGVFRSDVKIDFLYFDENSALSGGNLVLACPSTVDSSALADMNSTYLIYVPVNQETLYNQYVNKFANYKSHIFEHGQRSNTDSNYMIKTKDDGTIEIIRYFGDTIPANYTVPQTLDGKQVTSIGNYAFTHLSKNVNLVPGTLNLGTSITKVGNYAFANLDFEKLSLSGVKEIGSYAFANNDSLTYLSLPSAVTIKDHAFYNNNALQIVRFYDSIKSLGDNMLDGCEELRNVYFSSTSPSSITYNNNGLVFGSLTTSEVNIRVPSGTLPGYRSKFAYYSSRISVGQIDDADFSYRVSSDGVEIISYEGQSTSIVIPNQINGMNVVKILDEAFVNSLNLQSVTLPSTLTSISSHAFINNNTIKYVYVTNGTNNKFVAVDNVLYMRTDRTITTLVYYPIAKNTSTSYSFAGDSTYNLDNVTMIYENAFYGNPYLETITVPSSVRYIGESAFASMPSLKSVTFTSTSSVPILYGTNIFDITVDDLKIYVQTPVYNMYVNDQFFKYYKRFIVAA